MRKMFQVEIYAVVYNYYYVDLFIHENLYLLQICLTLSPFLLAILLKLEIIVQH